MENVTFTIPFDGVLILTGIVLSLLVSLVTNKVTDGRTKAYLLAGLSALSQVVAEFTIAVNDGSVFDIGQAALRAIATFLVAIGKRFRLARRCRRLYPRVSFRSRTTGVSAVASSLGYR